MTIEEQVLQRLRSLTPDKQKEVLDFADSLRSESGVPRKLRSLEGLLEDFDINITEEDIAQARREMWGNFPRDLKKLFRPAPS